MFRDRFMRAAIAEYEATFNRRDWCHAERAAARAAVRGMLLRMGMLDEFLIAYAVLPGDPEEEFHAMP